MERNNASILSYVMAVRDLILTSVVAAAVFGDPALI